MVTEKTTTTKKVAGKPASGIPNEKSVGKKATKKVEKKVVVTIECNDQFCPVHGKNPIKMRGRVFQGEVVKLPSGRVTIAFERMNYLRKYERYEKRKTKLHARLPDCMKAEVKIGDRLEIAETRPMSKTIHFVATKIIKAKK